MIEADTACVAHRLSKQGYESAIAVRSETHRRKGRYTPILSEVVETVRRRTDGKARKHVLRSAPDFATVIIDADGDIGNQANGHFRSTACIGGGGQLLLREPLQEDVKVDLCHV